MRLSLFFFFFKQKTAYEMRISDWSSDVCSSDLPVYKGADSRRLLRAAFQKVCAAGWLVGNIDATIHAQTPKMAPHIAAMAANIAVDLDVAPAMVNIKAKTAEGLGYLGRKEGIAADAVVLLVRGSGGA